VADARRVGRGLVREPTFTTLVTLTIALGIGPSAAVFGLIHDVLYTPLPGVPNTHEAVYVVISSEGRPAGLSLPHYQSLRSSSPALQGLAGHLPSSLQVIPAQGRPIAVEAEVAFGDFFEVLGASAVAGHLPDANGLGPNSDPFVAVISERLSERVFGRRADPIGASLRTTAGDFTVVGVVGAGFRGLHPNRKRDVWLPLSSLEPLINFPMEVLYRPDRPITGQLIALPSEGTTPRGLRNDLAERLRQTVRGSPEAATYLEDVQADVLEGLHALPHGRELTRKTMVFLGWGVAIILTIACANVANLLVFRNLSRRGAIATERVLGASSRRIARRHLMESVALGSGGAVGAILVAGIVTTLFDGWTLAGAYTPEGSVLGSERLFFVAVTGLGSALCFGSIPAILAGRFDLPSALRIAGARTTGGAGRVRAGLAAGQLGLTLALAVGAISMGRTLANLRAVDTGVNIEGVARVSLDAPPDEAAPQRFARYRSLLTAVENVPVVTSVALDEYGVHGSRAIARVRLPDQPVEAALPVVVRSISPGWFDLFGMEVVHGGTFGKDEWLDGPSPSIVITRVLAHSLFDREEVVGKTLVTEIFGERSEQRIIGVVDDYRSMADPDEAVTMVLVPFGSYIPASITVMARSLSDSRAWLSDFRSAIEKAVPDQPVPEPVFVSEDVSRLHETERRLTVLLVTLAAVGAVLSAIGLYGVTFFLVSRRKREFGIRQALGAGPRQVLALVGRSVIAVWVVGLGVGIAGSAGLSLLLENRLFGVERMAPGSIIGGSILICVVSLMASLKPARAAIRAEPIEVLRAE